MTQPIYIARSIDSVTFELMPDGELVIHQRDGQRIVLDPVQAYATYLMLKTPHVAALLRRVDNECQQKIYEAKYAG